jgi:DNA-binding MarR family transcriptional regulator
LQLIVKGGKNKLNIESVKELLYITHRTMRYTHCKESFGNIPKGEFFVMNVISDFCKENTDPDVKGISVTNIANILLAATANTSNLLRNMESKGYIERIFDDNDRRAVYIRLSPKGEDIIMTAKKKTEERFLKIFKGLGEKDADEYIRISRKLYKILQEDQTNTLTADKGKII